MQEHEAGAKHEDLLRKHGMSAGSFYTWMAKCSWMTVSEAKRLRALENEKGNSKELLPEQMLAMAALKELPSKKVVTRAVKREVAAHLKALFDLSERRRARSQV